MEKARQREMKRESSESVIEGDVSISLGLALGVSAKLGPLNASLYGNLASVPLVSLDSEGVNYDIVDQGFSTVTDGVELGIGPAGIQGSSETSMKDGAVKEVKSFGFSVANIETTGETTTVTRGAQTPSQEISKSGQSSVGVGQGFKVGFGVGTLNVSVRLNLVGNCTSCRVQRNPAVMPSDATRVAPSVRFLNR